VTNDVILLIWAMLLLLRTKRTSMIAQTYGQRLRSVPKSGGYLVLTVRMAMPVKPGRASLEIKQGVERFVSIHVESIYHHQDGEWYARMRTRSRERESK